ncbi:beta strand repeat-containing protein, partial [Salinicola rhizosphaerae]|uniref:beta strand repeat-containing protein n=1 Tax=Salinicola rhizosphaerae TaxID=1443141 RepID=UPI00167B7B97
MAALVTVVRVDGNVFLMDPRKLLAQGMAVPEGAMLVAPDGGRVVLADGTILPLNAGQPVTLEIFDGVATVVVADPAAQDADVASLQAAIAAGVDPTAVQEAPAAGAGGEGGGSLSGSGGFSSPFDIARTGREESSVYRYAASFTDTGTTPVTPATFSPQSASTTAETGTEGSSPSVSISIDPIAVDDIVNSAESQESIVLTGKGSGDAVAGDLVTVTVGGVAYSTVLADDLSFSVTVPGELLAENPSATATITHTEGDVSVTATSTRPYSVDLDAPAPTVQLDPIATDDLLNAGESATDVTLSGTVGGDAAAGDTVTVIVGGQQYQAVVDDDLGFSVVVPGSALAANDSVTAVISHADSAGNVGTSTASRDYGVDTTSPTLGIELDTIAGDNVVNAAEANQSVPVSGSVTGEYAAGDRVTLTVGTQTYTGTVASNGTFSINVPGSVLAQNSSISAAVSHTDAAGNVGSANTAASYGVDTTAPVVTISLNTAAGDDVINAAESRGNVSVSGKAGGDAVQGDTVTISVGGQTYTATVGANGTFSASVPGSVLANAGTDSIRASVSHTDAAGNTGTATTTHAYDVDTTAPALAITLGTIAGDNVVNAAEANQSIPVIGTVTGEYAAGDRVTLTVGTQTYTGTVASNGTFSINVPGSVLAQNSSISTAVSHTDAAGNVGSANTAASYGVDTTAPVVTISLNTVAGDDVINAAESRDNVSVSGKAGGDAVQGDTITISVGGQTYTATVGANGTFSASVPGTVLANAGTDSIRASVSHTDAAGNTGTATTTHAYTVDVTPPDAAADSGATGENRVLSVPAANGVLANDTDVDSAHSALSVSAVNGTAASVGTAITGSNGGTFTLNADGSYSFNPGTAFDRLAAGQTDTTKISYTVSDGQGGTATSTLTVTVTGTNDAPVAVADTQTTGENTVLTGQVPAATDVDGTIAGYELATDVGAGNGSLSFNSDGSYTFTPGADFDALAAGESRDVTFSYTATDNDGGVSAPQTVTITVTGTNDAPVAAADTQTTGENTVLTGQVPAATDVDGTIASYALDTDVGQGNGSLAFNADGSYTFDPGTDFDALAAGESRDVTFTYTATDNDGGVSAPQTVTITVTGTNDAPVAVADTQTTGENTALTGQVPAATDVDGTIASYQLATGVGSGNGSLTFNADGSYTFTPGADFDALAAGESRDVTFTYTATDNDGGVSAPQTVTITVTGTNDAPVAKADTGSTGENTTLTVTAANGVLANDSDVDGGTLSVSAVNGIAASVGTAITGSNGGTFTLNADGSYRFNPGTAFDRLAAGQTDTTQVSYTVSDGQGGTATSTLTVTVTGTNDVPVAKADTGNTGENTTLTVTAANGVLANDSDVDGGTLVVSAVNGTAASVGTAIAGSNGGTFTLNADGSYSFNPGTAFDRLAAGQKDTTQITYTVSDGQGGTATSTLTVTVTGTNDAPVAAADTQTTGENTALTGQVPAATDVDGTIASYALDTDVGQGNGSLSFNSDGSYTFTPGTDFDALAAGESRDVTFTYTATDNAGASSAPVTVTITVTGTNDAPVAKADTRTTDENTVLTGQVPAATDVDGTIAGYELATNVGAGNGSLAFNADGSYTFTPGADFDALAAGESRDVTFTYTATDNDGGVSA